MTTKTMKTIKIGLSEAEILKPTIDIATLAEFIGKAAKSLGKYNVQSMEPDITCDKMERLLAKKSGLLMLISESARGILEYAEEELETIHYYDDRNN